MRRPSPKRSFFHRVKGAFTAALLLSYRHRYRTTLVVFFVIVIVAAFGSAYLPPHLLTVLIGKDALLLSLGMVAQEQ